MNKITKGALATGLGVALLLGGAGTLAVWNVTEDAEAGVVTAGDLNLTASGGQWKEADGTIIPNINEHRIVPGDKVSFEQKVDITLVGNNMKAELTLVDEVTNKFDAENVEINPVALTRDGQVAPTTLTPAHSGQYTLATTFEFLASTDGRNDVDSTYDLSQVSYKLEQVIDDNSTPAP